MKVCIWPEFGGEDKGDGGVRRVVEAQRRWLPEYDVEVVKDPELADVVATHIMAPTQLLRQMKGKPLVVHNHGLYWAEYEWEAEWCYKANEDCMEAIRIATAITAPSEWVAQAIRRNSLRDVAVINHGVDLEDWEVRRSKGFVLWNKTRVDPVCDPEPLNRLAAQLPDVQFVTTYGDEASNVGITGTLPYEQAKTAIMDAGVYLCTTRETFGIGTLEAMAAGVPVVGWKFGGQVEIVEHGVTGFLVDEGDYKALAAAIQVALDRREEMGGAGRRLVKEHYQWKDIVSGYAKLYTEVAEQKAERPKVSVVVPAYNLEEYLPETLDSVAGQSLKAWECIVVDDHSPDGCGQIAEEFASRDKRFRVIHNAENQYLAGALNVGIAAAKGEYIVPLDADNMLAPRTLEVLATELDKDRSMHIAYGRVRFVNQYGKDEVYQGHENDPGHSGWPMEFRGDWQLTHRNGDRPANLIPSTAMYRKEVWTQTGGYRRRYRTAEDADFWTRAASYGFRPRMVTEADTLIYRNRHESMSRNEEIMDWTLWMPWCSDRALPPAAVISSKQAPVPQYDQPQVAVVIPVGPDHGELVIDALDSVDSQTFRRWECIVVNDTGKPLRWLPSWAREIPTVGMVGVAKARNLGIAAAIAPLFVPLDADDTLESPALDMMLDIFRQHGGYVYTDFNQKWADKPMDIWEAPEYDAARLLKSGCLHAVTGLYRVSDWQTVGGFDEKLPAWEDWDFQLKFAEVGICGTRAAAPLFTYRKNTGSRRDENVANFERSKRGIFEKWEPFFEGRQKLVGCNKCPGGGGGRAARQDPLGAADRGRPVQPATAEAAASDFVIVEYIGRNEGAMTFRGPSKTEYRFGARPSERQKLVHKADAEWFARLTEFRVRQPTQEEAVPA